MSHGLRWPCLSVDFGLWKCGPALTNINNLCGLVMVVASWLQNSCMGYVCAQWQHQSQKIQIRSTWTVGERLSISVPSYNIVKQKCLPALCHTCLSDTMWYHIILIRGRSRISCSKGRHSSRRWHRPMILPNFPKSCMKLRKFWAVGGGTHQECPPSLDLPLLINIKSTDISNTKLSDAKLYWFVISNTAFILILNYTNTKLY